MTGCDITVRLFAGLEDHVPEGHPEQQLGADEAPNVLALLERLGLRSRAGLVLVNGRHAGVDQVLAPGDEVDLFPPLGGG